MAHYCSEADLHCSVCNEIFKDPVLLSCSHSFCKACVQSLREEKQTQECPVCEELCSWSHPPCNQMLKNQCTEHSKQKAWAESAALCCLHLEKLKLFCLDHHQPACVICRDSRIHTNHKMRPIYEAAKHYKFKLKKLLETLQNKLNNFEKDKKDCDEAEKLIKTQAANTEQQIKEHFKKLHQFLEEEEETRISALRREEEQKSHRMKREMEVLSRVTAALSETVRATEEELKTDDSSFLKNCKAAVERVKQHSHLEAPQLPPGALIDVAKHLGNLRFNIWNKMKDLVSYSPVIFDPNTTNIMLSKGFVLPDNPGGFDRSSGDVMAFEGFDSGFHSWDIKINWNYCWSVGVLEKSHNGNITGSWGIHYSDYEYTAFSPLGYFEVSASIWAETVRVTLDWYRGELSFTDTNTDTHIHTFKHTFTKKLFPFISTSWSNSHPLSILPMKVSVKVEQ